MTIAPGLSGPVVAAIDVADTSVVLLPAGRLKVGKPAAVGVPAAAGELLGA